VIGKIDFRLLVSRRYISSDKMSMTWILPNRKGEKVEDVGLQIQLHSDTSDRGLGRLSKNNKYIK